MKISIVYPSVREDHIKRITDAFKDADEIIVVKDKIQYVAALNKGYKQSTGDLIVWASDRYVPQQNWREKLPRHLARINNSGVLSFMGNIVGFGAMTRDYVEQELCGNIAYPEYIHYHFDQEIGEVARKHQKYVEAWDITDYVLHKYDNLNQECVEHDSTLFQERQRLGFPYP